MTAKIFGGTIYGDGWTSLGTQPHYNLKANLVNADLATRACELAWNNRNLRGHLSGNVELGGLGHNRTSLGGVGHLYLRDANVSG